MDHQEQPLHATRTLALCCSRLVDGLQLVQRADTVIARAWDAHAGNATAAPG